jgi:NADH dehydrogenase (ubiquinone) 1 alpha subcomplex subunit 9
MNNKLLSSTFHPLAQGRGGRSSRAGASVTIFGVSGFLGRYVVNRLGREGWLIRAATRGDDMEIRHLRPLTDYGKLAPHYYDAKNEASVAACIPPGTDVVVNLVGKTYDTKHVLPWWINNTVEDSNVKATRMIASVARRSNVKHFVQMSCARADPNSTSTWSRTKALSESVALSEFPGATIVRAGQMYGEEDKFLNFWAWCLKKLPIIPVVDGGVATVNPVFVGDVAEAMGLIIGDWERFAGEKIDLLGSHPYQLKQIIEYIAHTIGVSNPQLINTTSKGPLALAAAALEKLPNPYITRDLLETWKCSDISSKSAMTFDTLGLRPQSFENKAYNFLYRYRAGGHFVELRNVEKSVGPAHVSHQLSSASVTTTTTSGSKGE